jgi:hypothetical protein
MDRCITAECTILSRSLRTSAASASSPPRAPTTATSTGRLRELAAHPEVDLGVFALGAHLSPEFGSTVNEIERDGFPIKARIECLLSSDTDTGMAKTIGIAILGLADALTAWRPDCCCSSPTATRCWRRPPSPSPCAFPSLTSKAAKSRRAPSTTRCATLSPSSPTSTSPPLPTARRRVIAMGEEPWRVHHAGAPSLDHLRRSALLDRKPSKSASASRSRRPCLPPGTRSPSSRDTNAEADAFFAALAEAPGQLIFVYPNADAGGHALIERTKRPGSHAPARTSSSTSTP